MNTIEEMRRSIYRARSEIITVTIRRFDNGENNWVTVCIEFFMKKIAEPYFFTNRVIFLTFLLLLDGPFHRTFCIRCLAYFTLLVQY